MLKILKHLRSTPIAAFCLLASSVAMAADNKPVRYEDSEVMMRLVLRSSEQLNAFYLGREFPQPAIDKILETCLFAAIVHNKTIDVLWLDLNDWEFFVEGKPVRRIKRDYWKQQWKEVGLSQSHQSTFGWTLLPEARDLRTDEGAGGGVVIPTQTRPFDVIAKFSTGKNKSGKQKIIEFKGVSCPASL